MSRAERAILLFLLAMTAGAADGWTFLGFGGVFVANMTGNMVLLGISFLGPHVHGLPPTAGNWGETVQRGLSMAAFAVGVAIASYVTGRHAPRPQKVLWTPSVTGLMVFETLCAAGVEWGWYAHRDGAHVGGDALMAGMAICMGVQSVAVLQLNIPGGVVTTYMTATLTLMVRGLTRKAAGEPQEEQVPKAEFNKQTWMQAATLAAYLLSAVVTGWVFEEAPKAVGVIPVLCLATVSFWSLLRGSAYSIAE